MDLKNRYGFTLVELIVVVTILAILATIWFVSYSSYLLWARDSNRIASLTAISWGFELHKAKWKLPLPDKNIELKSDGVIIWWQWYAGANVLETIAYNKWWKDPLDDTYFSYMLTSNRKNYQLLAFLETKTELEIDDVNAFLSPYSYAESIDYYDRYPKLYGSELGIMTDIYKTPIHEVISVVNQWYIDILTTTGTYIAYFDDENKIKWDHNILSTLSPYASCSRLRDYLWKKVSGIYKINPTWVSWAGYDVYCEMELGWWGWTLIATSAEDGVNTWTYNDRNLLFNNVLVWDIYNYQKDFKSRAYNEIYFKDMMFLDKQWVWWAYDDIQPNREKTVDQFIPQVPVCAHQWTWRAYHMTSWSVSKNLWVNWEHQDRTLFFTVRDHEAWCTLSTDDNDQHAIGPTWGYKQNNGHSPDDPGLMWWGPSETQDSAPHGGERWHRPSEECRDARVGRKSGNDVSICSWNDGDYILWFVR